MCAMPDSTAPQRTPESLTSGFHTVCLISGHDSFRVNCGPSSIPALDGEVASSPDLLSSPRNGRFDPFPTRASWVVADTRPFHTRAAILDVHGGFYCRRLLVEPYIFHTPAIVHTVDHNGQPFYLRLPTGCCAEVINDWPCPLLLQLMVDFPH